MERESYFIRNRHVPLNKQFERDFPRLFANKPPTRWSGVPDGWRHLLVRLCIDLESCMSDAELKEFRMITVNSKNGSLDFDFEGGNETVSVLISMADHISEFICQNCCQPRLNDLGVQFTEEEIFGDFKKWYEESPYFCGPLPRPLTMDESFFFPRELVKKFTFGV